MSSQAWGICLTEIVCPTRPRTRTPVTSREFVGTYSALFRLGCRPNAAFPRGLLSCSGLVPHPCISAAIISMALDTGANNLCALTLKNLARLFFLELTYCLDAYVRNSPRLPPAHPHPLCRREQVHPPGAMPPRIGHTKSRGGCRQCKARKVKCSEDHPQCNACVRLRLECSYFRDNRPTPNPDQTSSGKTAAVTTKSRSSSASDGGHQMSQPPETDHPAAFRNRDNLLEMFLIWHFTAVVKETFPYEREPLARRKQSDDLVQTIFTHNFVLNSILAVAAQHLVLTRGASFPGPFADVDFSQVHAFYLDQSLQSHRQALDAINPDNAEPVLLVSILLCYVAYRPFPDQIVGGEPFTWLKMSQAIVHVAMATHAHLPPHSSVTYMMSVGMHASLVECLQLELGNTASIPGFEPQHISDFFKELAYFQDPEENPLRNPSETPEERHACMVALGVVDDIYQAARTGEDPTLFGKRLLAFGPRLPPLFVHMVDQRKPRALAILAQFAALTKWAAGEDEDYRQFWFSGFAAREIEVVRSLLPADWLWTLKWPLSVLSEEGRGG
ncbi:hypothetical protein GGR56DRAFT_616263 [Xylariaceae sp. FL0804]|nr:hypothetical protein GGR56DRAFT_616263 [Xylariaceae sp. FL0804]